MSDARLRQLEREAWAHKTPEAWSRWAEESERAKAAGAQAGPVSPWDVPGMTTTLTDGSTGVHWVRWVPTFAQLLRALNMSVTSAPGSTNCGQGALRRYEGPSA